MATIASLVVEMSANTRGLKRSLSNAKSSVAQFATDVRKRANQIGKWLVGAFTAATAAVAAFVKSGLSSIDRLAKTSSQLGTTAAELRGIQQAASDAGIEQGRLESTLRSFNKRLGDTVNGTGEAQKAYAKLGIEASDLAQMPLPEQLALIAERINQLDSAAERASIADRLMSGGRQMVNLFDSGGDAIRDAIKEVDEFGLSLSEIETQRVEDANDAMSRIGNAVEAVRNRVTVALAPALEAMAKHFTDAARASNGFAEQTQTGMDKVVKAGLFVLDAAEGISRAFKLAGAGIALMVIEARRDLAQLAESIYSGPIDAINALIEQMNRVPGVDLGEVQQPGFVRDLQNIVSTMDGAAQEARDDMRRILMEEMPSVSIGRRIEESRSLQAGRDAGLGGAISSDAITSAQKLADVMNAVSESGKALTDETDDQTESTKDAAKAAKDFGDAAVRSARAMQSATGQTGATDPRYNIKAGGDTLEERARARFEKTANRIGTPQAIQWYGSSGTGSTSSSAAASSAMGSNAAGSNVSRTPITLHVVGKDGQEASGDGEVDDALLKSITNIFGSVASAV